LFVSYVYVNQTKSTNSSDHLFSFVTIKISGNIGRYC